MQDTWLNQRIYWIRPQRGVVNKVANPAFMHPSDPKKGWSNPNPSSGVFTEEYGGVEGIYSLKVSGATARTSLSLNTGTYSLSFYMKAISGSVPVTVKLVDQSSLATLFSTTLYPSQYWDLYLVEDIQLDQPHNVWLQFEVSSTSMVLFDMITFVPGGIHTPFYGDMDGCGWTGERFGSDSIVIYEVPYIGYMERFGTYGLFPFSIDGVGYIKPNAIIRIKFHIPGITYDQTLSSRTELVHHIETYGELCLLVDVGSTKKLLYLVHESGLDRDILEGGQQSEVVATFRLKEAVSLSPVTNSITSYPVYQSNTSSPIAAVFLDDGNNTSPVSVLRLYPSTNVAGLRVRALAEDVDGNVYLGGYFRTDSSLTFDNGICLVRPGDWSTPVELSNRGLNGPVRYIITSPDKTRLYVCGEFTALADGTDISDYVATYDGSSWISMGPGLTFAPDVLAYWKGNVLAIDNQKLYIWDGSSWSQDTSFNVSGTFYAAVVKDDELHLVGNITAYVGAYNDVPIYGYVVYDLANKKVKEPPAQKSLMLGNNPGIGYDVDIDDHGIVYVVGDFDQYGLMKVNNFLVLGEFPISYGRFDGPVLNVDIDRITGDIHVVGTFTNVDNVPVRGWGVFQGSTWYQGVVHVFGASDPSENGFRRVKVLSSRAIVLTPKNSVSTELSYQGPVVYSHLTPATVSRLSVHAKGPTDNVVFRHAGLRTTLQFNGPVPSGEWVLWFVDEISSPRRRFSFSNEPFVAGLYTAGPIHFPVVFDNRASIQVNSFTQGGPLPVVFTVWHRPLTLGD